MITSEPSDQHLVLLKKEQPEWVSMPLTYCNSKNPTPSMMNCPKQSWTAIWASLLHLRINLWKHRILRTMLNNRLNPENGNNPLSSAHWRHKTKMVVVGLKVWRNLKDLFGSWFAQNQDILEVKEKFRTIGYQMIIHGVK